MGTKNTGTKTPVRRDYLTRTTPTGANFAPAAQKYLSDRAIDDDVAESRGWSFVSSGSGYADHEDVLRASGVTDKYVRDGGTAHLIPLWSLDAEEPTSYQVRVGSPDLLGAGQRFRTPSGSTRGDSLGHLPADVNPIESNRAAVLDPSVPLIVTEGAGKADSMISALRREGRGGKQEAGVVSLTGVGMAVLSGTDGEQDTLHTETLGSRRWAPLLDDRDVVIAYDADFADNKQVAESLRRLAICLERAGADRVRVIDLSGITDDELPERLHGAKVGIDDYLAAVEEVGGSARPMHDILRAAGRWDTVEKKLIRSKLIPARATRQPLSDIFLPVEHWVADDTGEGIPDGVAEAIDWARDEAGNPFVRATSDVAKEWLGGWRLDVERALARFVTEGDREESRRLIALLSDVDADAVSDALAVGYDALLDLVGAAPSAALDVRGMSLRKAIESVRNGGSGMVIPLHEEFARGAKFTTTAEIGKSADTHGIFKTMTTDEGAPIRVRVLPYVLAQWGYQEFRKVGSNLATSVVPADSRFVSAAIFPGGRVESFAGFGSGDDTDPRTVIRGLRSAGVRLPEPVGAAEDEAARRCLQIVGADDREETFRLARMGWARLPDGSHVWASTYGAVGASGIRTDALAQIEADEDSNLGLPEYARAVGFDEIADRDDLLSWPDLVEDFLALARDDRVTIPAFGQFLYSFLPLGIEERRTVTLAFSAEPGSAKSALLARCLHMQSRIGFGALKSFAVDVDSEAKVRRTLHFYGHQFVLGDDYRPTAKGNGSASQEEVMNLIVTAAFDRVIPGRVGVETTEFVGVPAVSAETLSGVDSSRVQRLYVVDVAKDDISLDGLDEFSDVWTRGSGSGRARRIIAAYVQAIAAALDTNPTDPWVGTVPVRKLEDQLRRSLGYGSSRPELGVVQVATGIAAFVAAMTDLVIERYGDDLPEDYLKKTGVLFRDFITNASTVADHLLEGQTSSQSATEIAEQIVADIAEGIASGDYHLSGPDGGTPADADRFGWRTREDVHGRVVWEPNLRSKNIGRISRDGTKVLVLVRPLDEVRTAAGIALRKGEMRSRLARKLSEGYQDRGGEKISGLTVDASGKVFPMRGFVFDLETFGLAPVTDDSRSEPVQRGEKRRRDDDQF